MMSVHHPTTTPLSTSSPHKKHQSKRLHQKHPAVYTSRRTAGWCTGIRSSSNNKGENAGEEKSASSKRIDRREVLLGLGGLYGAAGLAGQALASPVGIPDRTACGDASSANIPGPLKCCPPEKVTTAPIVQWKAPSPGPLRVRKPAHEMNKDEVAKFKKAVQAMKDLDPEDPWHYDQQAKIHCTYCNGAYKQAGFDVPLQVHFSWLFLPWHRWYLYFFERILGKLINDDSFALPFWNYDRPEGMFMPSIYVDPSSSLYNPRRNLDHLEMLLDYNFSYDVKGLTGTEKEVIQANLVDLRTMYDSGIPTPELFMGDPLSAGELTAEDNSSGALERFHNTVHMWVGRHKDATPDPYIDMGDFSTAAKDMLFYGHHANVDRLWDIYRTARGKKVEFNNSDWLNAEFNFYDENKQVVKVNVKDTLSTQDLGYTYKDVPIPWMQRAPPKRPAAKPRSGSFSMVPVTEFGTEPKSLVEGPVRVLVTRPKTGRSQEEKEDENEVLVVDGIEVLDEGPVRFDVFITTPFGTFAGPDYGLPAGSFVKLPHRHKEGHKHRKAKLKLGITRLLEDLKAENAQKLVVTLVPRTGKVNVGGIHVEHFKTDN
ncbi:hypothetical protein MRB53_029714 [Persea americana]|uniref:Uncharacterized protein n=1 Tax=Persea americana TaxID=3435 RepID=A0ACC2KJ36_PERAE|nr:hypothetical protein MRB53_029714 [Persea americana]